MDGFLKTHGREIVYGKGEKVLLRGVGLGNWLLPEGYMWKFGNEADRPRRIEKLVTDLLGSEEAQRFWKSFRRDYIAEADIKEVARLGFNSVRPALNARLFLSDDEEARPLVEGFELLDKLVQWCNENKVYIILDMHGAPGGQTGQNIDDSRTDQPELFSEPANQARLEKLWVLLARRYANESTVAGYDLLNEPLPARTGAEARYKADLEPLYKRLTKAIRAVDSRHMIIVEGADWANDWSVFTRPFDSNLVYQFHYYCWDTPSKVKNIQQYLDFQRRFNVPVWVGETGERDPAIYWATSEYFEANRIGWALWPWKKLDAENCPVSIKRPQGWDKITGFARGAAKPERAVAQSILDEFLANIRLENCVPHMAVVNSVLRRAPVRVEAENYAWGGLGVAYQTNKKQNSKFYRQEEFVPVSVHEPIRRSSGQFVSLSAGEWTDYQLRSDARQGFDFTVRVRVTEGTGEAALLVGTQRLPVKVDSSEWVEMPLGKAILAPGVNNLKWTTMHGKLDLDWLQVDVAATPESARREAAGN